MSVKKFAKTYKSEAKAESNVPCGTGLAGKICRKNTSKTNKFHAMKSKQEEFIHKMKKSIDWKDTNTQVDIKDQDNAETTTSPELIQYLKTSVDSDMSKIPFAKGMLTVAKVSDGLYSGFFSDEAGQVIDKFPPTTLDIIAKNLEVKGYYSKAVPVSTTPYHDEHQEDEIEDRAIAREEAIKVFQELSPTSPEKSIKIKYGSFELEIKKSINDFVKSYRNDVLEKSQIKDDIRKAINSWKRNSAPNLRGELDAARELLTNWDFHKESFHQTLFAIEQLKKKHGKTN